MLRPAPDAPLPPSPPRSAHRRAPTAYDFPTPAGNSFAVTKRDQGLISPTQSSFTFSDEEKLLRTNKNQPSIEERPVEGDTEQGAAANGRATAKPTKIPSEKDLTNQKSQFYTGVFEVRESSLHPRERVHKGSIIIAEVKTNVIVRELSVSPPLLRHSMLTTAFSQINDEFLFLNEISQHLSQRYQRPLSSIFVTLHHSACLLFAGSFDSAYILTISALPSQILPTTNKRNAALMQSFLASSLGVLPARGVIRFVGLPEEYLATAGTTVSGQIERLEKASSNECKPSSEAEEIIPRRPSRRKVQNRPLKLSLVPRSVSMPGSRLPSPTFQSPAMPAMPAEKSLLDRRAERMQKVGKRKSFFSIFGR